MRKCKHVTPFLLQSQGHWAVSSPQLSRPVQRRTLLGLQTLSLSELQLITPLLSHYQKTPQTGRLPVCGAGLLFEENQFLVIFSLFICVIFPTSLLFFISVFNYHASLKLSSSNLKGYFKRLLAHWLQISKVSFGKSNHLSLSPQLPKVIMSHVFDPLTEILNRNSWPFSELFSNCLPILLISAA